MEDELAAIEEKVTAAAQKINEPNAGDMKTVESYMDDDLDVPEVLRYISNHCSGEVLKKSLALLGFTFLQ
ncbi:hypothetical protein HYS00_03305 [Candidatus Microgenomates bacterium]|nr:hypothetical protein [Candidatus Microgenomates bacterium]